eukprot:evm.model.NODE_7421_length_28612_cov_28.772577.8
MGGYFVVVHIIFFLMDVIKLSKIPGPVPVPVLGNLYDRMALTSFIGWLSKLRRKYGKIYRVFTGSRAYVVLMDKVAAREALSDPRTFVKGPDYKEKFSFVFGDGLVTSVGEKHKTDRALFAKYFTQKKIEMHLPVLCEQTLKAINAEMEPHVGQGQGVVDLEHFFSILAFKMFCRFAINHEFPDSEVWSELTSRGSNIIGESIVLGIPVTTWIPRVKKLLEDTEKFHRCCDPLIDARILAHSKGEEMVDDPLTVMVQEKMTRKQMYSHLVTMLAAGHDTTAFCTCYTLFLLAKNPKIQAKLKAEIKRVMGTRTNITPEDIAQLTYAKNCFQESLRIYSVVPHVTRVCIRDTKLSCGVTVPANTEVLVPICLLNRDTDEWGAPIDAFDPDRFEGITRESPSKGYFPFGYSTRSCIGATLALIEGTVMITLLAQRYTFLEEPSFKLKLKSGITMVSSNGVKVRVERDMDYAS